MSDSDAREAMEFDVLVVGGGPAGLACAIRLKQLNPDAAICLVEKGSEIGAHILSGAVLEPRALDELIPDWRDDPPALATPVRDDRFMFLTESRAFKLPTPPQMHNEGNYIVSLGNVCRWLGAKAEALGVEIYPGFAASETIIEDGQVKGVVAGVMGITRDGEKGPNYQPGMELRATYTVFAEGCRGSLTKRLFETFDLRRDAAPQTYALGMKELWEIPKDKHTPGLVSKFGGKFIVRGGNCTSLEGGWTPQRIVVLKFKDLAAAQAYYNSETYTRAREAREGAGSIRMIAVEGV